MIVDKSAILSIINLEDDAKKIATQLENASGPNYISAVNYFELTALIDIKYGDKGMVELNNFFKKAEIKVHEVNEKIVDIARDAYKTNGRHKKKDGLAFGDCFSYALAKYLDDQLLCKGTAFNTTDVKLAA